MKYLTYVIAFVISCFMSPSMAQNTFAERIYSQMLQDTNDLMKDYESDKTVYTNAQINRYTEIIQEVCKDNNSASCPELNFTSLNIVGAAMYPNGVMLLNENSMNRLSYSQISFVLAQQFYLFKTEVGKQRYEALAAYLGLLGIETTAEKALTIQSLVPELISLRQEMEKSAFAFAFSYIQKKGLHINCMNMMSQIINDEEKFKNNKKAIQQRCNVK